MLENLEELINEDLNTPSNDGYMDYEDENSVVNQIGLFFAIFKIELTFFFLDVPPISDEYEERKKRNQDIFDILYNRDGNKFGNVDKETNEEDTFDMMDSDGYFRRPVALADVFK